MNLWQLIIEKWAIEWQIIEKLWYVYIGLTIIFIVALLVLRLKK